MTVCLGADRTVQCWRVRRRPVAGGWQRCPGLKDDRPRWLWPLHCCRAHGALACGYSETESVDYFTNLSETARLRDFENRNNTTVC